MPPSRRRECKKNFDSSFYNNYLIEAAQGNTANQREPRDLVSPFPSAQAFQRPKVTSTSNQLDVQ